MKAYKTLEEVKEDVRNGHVVYWKSTRYQVSDNGDSFLVFDLINGWCGGNIEQDNPSDFFRII